MKDATYAPIYCAMYPPLVEIGRRHGYAMAVHGTLAKDMDLMCIPWTEAPSEPKDVVKEITKTLHIRTIGEPNTTRHGRERWTVSVGFGECFIDLSFMPRVSARQREPSAHVAWCRYVTATATRGAGRADAQWWRTRRAGHGAGCGRSPGRGPTR